MNTVIQLLLAAIALWSAHLAGVHYALSKNDPRHRRAGIVRSIFAVLAVGAMIFGHYPSL